MKKQILCILATRLEKFQLFPNDWKFEDCGQGVQRCDANEDFDLYVATCGIGMVNAAIITERLMPFFENLHAVLSIGIAGISHQQECSIGDWAIISEEWFGDVGVLMPDEFLPLDEIGFSLHENQKNHWNQIPVSHQLAKRLAEVFNKPQIPGMTVNAVSGSESRIKELQKLAPFFAENMEGAAIAYVCWLHHIRFAEIRAISNQVGVRDKSKWNIKESLEKLSADLPDIIKTVSDFEVEED